MAPEFIYQVILLSLYNYCSCCATLSGGVYCRFNCKKGLLMNKLSRNCYTFFLPPSVWTMRWHSLWISAYSWETWRLRTACHTLCSIFPGNYVSIVWNPLAVLFFPLRKSVTPTVCINLYIHLQIEKKSFRIVLCDRCTLPELLFFTNRKKSISNVGCTLHLQDFPALFFRF